MQLIGAVIVLLWFLLFAFHTELVYTLFRFAVVALILACLLYLPYARGMNIAANLQRQLRVATPALAVLVLALALLAIRPDRTGAPVSADVSNLVLAAEDVSPDYTRNWSKSGGMWFPCVVNDLSSDGEIAGYEATLNPSAHTGYVRSAAYKYVDERHAQEAYEKLITTIRSGIDPIVCTSGNRLDSAVTVSEARTGYPVGTWLFSTSTLQGAFWRHANVIEKLEMVPADAASLSQLVLRQDAKATRR